MTIALGETWSYTGTGDPNADLMFLAALTSGSAPSIAYVDDTYIIGDQIDGNASIQFTPEAAGTYTIFYRSVNYGAAFSWATLIVTGGNE